MTEYIRRLTKEDYSLYTKMENNLQEDYILSIFEELTEKPHTLFGLFKNKELLATAGYTVYAENYAMIGRFRSDSRYRGNGYGTKILSHTLEQAKHHPNIKWVGGNTERHNKAALTVLKKLGLPAVITLFSAQTRDVSALTKNGESWKEITSLARKKEWINQTYLNEDFEKSIFPYKTYYPFPAKPALFDGWLKKVLFFENQDCSRYLIIWKERADKDYIHVAYPWSDFMEQSGFFETLDYELKAAYKEDRTLWIDLTEEEVKHLPTSHPFRLPSPWVLHGMHVNQKIIPD